MHSLLPNYRHSARLSQQSTSRTGIRAYDGCQTASRLTIEFRARIAERAVIHYIGPFAFRGSVPRVSRDRVESVTDWNRERETAVEAVRTAAGLCRSVQSALAPDVLEKKDRSPVTVADFGSQAVICRMLGDAFPDDPIVAEEDSASLQSADNQPFLERIRAELQGIDHAGSDAEICSWIDRGSASEYSNRFWTLDPIDGTKGFLRKEQYAVSLALIVEGRITVAAVACPNLPQSDESESASGVIFSAVAGGGSLMIPQDASAATAAAKIQVTKTADSADGRFTESVESGHTSHSQAADVASALGISREPLRMDSQAKYAVVARGDADIYLRLPTRVGYQEKIWDHAGGVLIVEEAGGRVSDIDGKPLDFTRGRELSANRGVIVSNGLLHDSVLTAIKQAG